MNFKQHIYCWLFSISFLTVSLWISKMSPVTKFQLTLLCFPRLCGNSWWIVAKLSSGFTYMANTRAWTSEQGTLGKRGTRLCRGKWGQESVKKCQCGWNALSPCLLSSVPQSWAHTQSQRVLVAGRDLWMWPCPTPCSAAHLEQAAVAGPSTVRFWIPARTSPKQLLAFAFMPLPDSQNPSEGRFLQRSFVGSAGPQKCLS